MCCTNSCGSACPACAVPVCRARPVSFAFPVINTDGRGLCGAVYRLSCACGNFRNAISNPCGCVRFRGVMPGTYTLTELAAPFGTEPDPAAHEVTVSARGCVKIDGLPLCCFQSVNPQSLPPQPEPSNPPEVNVIAAGAVTLSGYGDPGSRVETTYPGSCAACCAVCASVRRDGSWSMD
ncbi:MAG: prealbumin-like fold domain-containing protein, partial [Oscillospiraceae bacterium]|nr:prealbumin-like fold domain-containing protein [Oscillospiraceae bacterium]